MELHPLHRQVAVPHDAPREAARELRAFDMAALAEATGSVLSAVLFGALAGSGTLPFPTGVPDDDMVSRRGGWWDSQLLPQCPRTSQRRARPSA